MGKDLKIVVTSERGDPCSLPDYWGSLDFDAKRFAVVWTLSGWRLPWTARLAKWLSSYALRATGMILAGINLWLILACHAFVAVRLGLSPFGLRDKSLIQQDIQALGIMKNLKAAIAFVKADAVNSKVSNTAGRRIAALRSAAARMGIA
jgi:hypothetical protein